MLLSVLFLLFLGLKCEEIQVIPVKDPKNITLAYGSCLNTYKDADEIDSALRAVINAQPDLWIWGGDAVYLDGHTFLLGTFPGPGYDIENEEYTAGIYRTLKENPTYVELRKKMPVIGVWDDHDYAYDNTDKYFKFKDRNMRIYLDFIDEPADSPRRKQKGIYKSYYVGEDKLIKIILIDIRYNSDPESKLSNLLDADTTKAFDDMLGDEQWAWLEKELQDNTSPYTLLVSGTQFLPDDRPVISNWFENSKDKLFDMIKANRKSGIILLSGDVHYAEILKHPCPARVGYKNLHEFTSSGLTHSAKEADIFDGIVPRKYSLPEDRFFDKNYGILRFIRKDDGNEIPNIIFEAVGLDGKIGLRREVSYDDVTFDQGIADSYTACETKTEKVKEAAKEVGVDAAEKIRDILNKVHDL